MTSADSSPAAQDSASRAGLVRNPFSPSPLARVSDLDEPVGQNDTITISTEAIRQAFSYLDAYLREPDLGSPAEKDENRPSRPGTVMSVVGDYGMGKTHLAVELLQHARENGGENVHPVYVDARPGTFAQLYRDFLQQLKPAEVLLQIKSYFSDVVVEYLRTQGEHTLPIAELIAAGDVQADAVVRNMNLQDNVLEGILRNRLEKVTNNPSFARALTLLRRPEFEEAIWAWLSGREPQQGLIERGIETRIDSEQAALDALGVFALLYGHRDQRLVLVIDEMERILFGTTRLDESVFTAFREFLRLCSQTGVFLTLMGLPDFREALPRDVEERIGPRIDMTALSTENAEDFIRESLKKLSSDQGLHPFNHDAVDLMVRLADGTPRKVLRLCYHIYHRAETEQRPVTLDMVESVSRTLTTVISDDNIRDHVAQVLVDQGRRFIEKHPIKNSVGARVDFWVFSESNDDSGCGIMVAGSLGNVVAVSELRRRVLSIRTIDPQAKVILIANGQAPEEVRLDLEEVFDAPPLIYRQITLADSIDNLLNRFVAPVTPASGSDALASIRDRVARMTRQQSSIYQLLAQFANDVDRWRTSSEAKLASFSEDLAAAIRTGRIQEDTVRDAGTVPIAIDPVTPERIRRLFEDAQLSIGEIRKVELLLDRTFSAAAHDERLELTDRLRATSSLAQDDATAGVGLGYLLQLLITAFESSVAGWFSEHPAGEDVDEPNKETLRQLCRTYAAVYESLPLRQFDAFQEVIREIGDASESVEEATRHIPRDDPREIFEELGVRVERMALTNR